MLRTYSKGLDKFTVLDLAVLVDVERVVDDTQLLARQENANLGHELFKFKLGQSSRLIFVELLHENKKLTVTSNLLTKACLHRRES